MDVDHEEGRESLCLVLRRFSKLNKGRILYSRFGFVI